MGEGLERLYEWAQLYKMEVGEGRGLVVRRGGKVISDRKGKLVEGKTCNNFLESILSCFGNTQKTPHWLFHESAHIRLGS